MLKDIQEWLKTRKIVNQGNHILEKSMCGTLDKNFSIITLFPYHPLTQKWNRAKGKGKRKRGGLNINTKGITTFFFHQYGKKR